jgi:hypothetical protein
MPFLTRRVVEAFPLPFDPCSPEGLAARWVRWVAAARADRNPIADATGEDAAANQPSDVFFLAGSYGERLTRRCVVPTGHDLFVPAFCATQRRPAGPPELVDGAHGSVAVDRTSVGADWIATPVPFLVSGVRLNLMTGRRTPVPMTACGWWKQVPALPPGEHEVHVLGGDGHGVTIDVRYQLLVHAAGARPPGEVSR